MKYPDDLKEEKLLANFDWEMHKLSKSLLAWGTLIENVNSEHELAEPEGLGIALRDYSESLDSIRSGIDEREVEQEMKKTAKKRGPYKKTS